MGLFGKLFDKKSCSICGGEIGLLGNRKLEDGNLCKNCSAKLSPFFEERRHSTVESIQEHLNYRQANQDALKDFHPTRTLGEYTKVYIDEAAKTFAVSDDRKWRKNNADVIPMSQIADVRVKIDEHKSELKRDEKDADGKTVRISYDPPRYRYSYDFRATIEMQESFRWFHEIRFALTSSTIHIEPQPAATGILGSLFSVGFDPHTDGRYTAAVKTGEELKKLLLGNRYTPAVPEAAAAPQSVECAYCGSKFTADGSGECPYCGAKVG